MASAASAEAKLAVKMSLNHIIWFRWEAAGVFVEFVHGQTVPLLKKAQERWAFELLT